MQMSRFRMQIGLHKYFNVFGNHCGKIARHLGFPYLPKNTDFSSSYYDLKDFRIVLSNAGTRQMGSDARFIPTEQEHWLKDVIQYSPKPVILIQHVPPDEFDNGENFYKKLAAMEMVSLVIHGHRHEATKLETHSGIPVLHMQALLKEGNKGIPDINVAEIEATPDTICITARALAQPCGAARIFTIDRRDLSLGAIYSPGCPHKLATPEQA